MVEPVSGIPVFLRRSETPRPEAVGRLVGTAEINEYGTLTITITPDELLAQDLPFLVKLDQIVGLDVGLEYRLDIPIKEKF